MTRAIPQNAAGGSDSDLPPIPVHNFTTLQFPEKLPSGRKLEIRNSQSLKDIYPFSILVIGPDSLQAEMEYDFLFQHVGVMYWSPAEKVEEKTPPWVDIRLSPAATSIEINLACHHMLRLLELKEQCLILHNTNAITETRNRQLNRIGIALMSEKNLGILLNLILDEAMELTGSDAGCLYLVEQKEGQDQLAGNYWANRQIRFKLTRNASVSYNFSEIVVPATKSSIIGYTLIEGKTLNIPDVYTIDPISEFRHNAGFDKSSGYHTRSMLTLPMKDNRGQVVGAIQLINKCRNRNRPITSIEAADEQVVPFQLADVNLSLSLASQASVALLNAQYELDIQALFEGFINASVTAIESRDPTTSGHSHRVADSCIRLSECLGRMDVGKFRDVHFSEPELRELRYAALLHDFGKIGVRENVLTKAKKLFPDEVEKIQHRADFIRRTIHWETAQAKVDLLKQGPNQNIEAVLKRIEEREAGDLANIDRFFSTILKANEPSRLDAATLDILKSIGSRTFRDVKGELEAFLKPDELSRLMIPQGTLSDAERDEINSHVSHTFKFLSKIPWTQDLRNVAYIAFSHHEKLDGTGYPRKLSGAAIPLPAQIMSICDIYDALAASDRPYKKAIPTEKALDILAMEVKGGKIDAELFQIFLDGKAYETFQK